MLGFTALLNCVLTLSMSKDRRKDRSILQQSAHCGKQFVQRKAARICPSGQIAAAARAVIAAGDKVAHTKKKRRERVASSFISFSQTSYSLKLYLMPEAEPSGQECLSMTVRMHFSVAVPLKLPPVA